jgi:hypothetical protein
MEDQAVEGGKESWDDGKGSPRAGKLRAPP